MPPGGSQALDKNAQPLLFLYSGICHLELGDIREAIADFNYIAETANLYTEPAKWYTALAYLKAADRDKAVEVLKEISDSGGAYAERAQQILSELEAENTGKR